MGTDSALSTNSLFIGYLHSNHQAGRYRCIKPGYFQGLNIAPKQSILSALWHEPPSSLLPSKRCSAASLLPIPAITSMLIQHTESDQICKNKNCDALVVMFLGLYMTCTQYYIGFDVAKLSNRVKDYFFLPFYFLTLELLRKSFSTVNLSQQKFNLHPFTQLEMFNPH